MDMLVNVFLLFLNFYTDLYVACKLANYSFRMNLKNSFIVLIMSTLYTLLIKFFIIQNIKILITFLFLIILLRLSLKLQLFSIIRICFFTITTMVFSEQVICIFFCNILNIDFYTMSNTKYLLIISNALIFILAISIININGILIKFFREKHIINIDNYFIGNIFIIILSNILLLGYYGICRYFNKYFNDKIYLFIMILCFFSICISLIFTYTNYLSIQNLKMLKIKEKEYDQLKLYSKSIENLIDDISSFKHDYNNIIFMLNGYLQNNDYNGLKLYFKKRVFSEEKYYDISKLKKINNSGVKGLLSAKISEIIKNNIKFNIEIFNDINDIYIDELDLCRILGIFLDNAFEASKCSKEKFISLSLIQDNGLNIIILNSYTDSVYLNSIFKKGYSSKGNHRGQGLFNVRSILNDKYPNNTILNTYIKNDIFIQDLYIKAK
ncbi:sensor histidine kinase [Clostridium botulinum D/C]|nr:sensor histidine kinase [Clostridium botulinum D/C]MCD3360596.1 sensor histidine kinase [Clostridium botulinum D/C]MCD3366371.1 sensor histidine kinase [Clostridium botulinum D/C]